MMKHFAFLILALFATVVHGFMPAQPTTAPSPTTLFAASGDDDIIGRRITVKGAVNGGYYRSCVLNEAGRFRRLIGTMSPPDTETDTAEIYVEGKKKMVEGFIRWVKRGNVGLNQASEVTEIVEEEPTGLYDGFYCKTH